ncbi:MAG: hypothetical protein ACPLPT_10635 [Moorellales bacterium]
MREEGPKLDLDLKLLIYLRQEVAIPLPEQKIQENLDTDGPLPSGSAEPCHSDQRDRRGPGRPPKLDPGMVVNMILRFARDDDGVRRATRSDADIAAAVEAETGVRVSEETIRQYRHKLGLKAFVERGRPMGARDKHPRLFRSRVSDPTRRPHRKLRISDEALARWTRPEYRWDAGRRRYVYAGYGARPRDLPRFRPPWGGGLGLP